MSKSLTPLLGAVLLAASTLLYAQTPPAPAPGGDQATKHEKMKAARKQAYQACEGKKDAEHRDCMRTEMCAPAKDPAKCEERMKQHAEAFNKAYDVCKGKATADDFRSCMRQQHIGDKKK